MRCVRVCVKREIRDAVPGEMLIYGQARSDVYAICGNALVPRR
jgi:hypothetical protein